MISVRIARVYVLMVALGLTLAGCVPRPAVKSGQFDCSAIVKSGIFDPKRIDDAIKEFARYDVEKQWAVCMCAREYFETPNFHFWQPFALEGERVVGFLKAKLIDAPDDRTIEAIVDVFEDMAWLESYDVAGNDELMQCMEERVKGMKHPFSKKYTEEMVARIRALSTWARLRAIEEGGEGFNRIEVISALRSGGFSYTLDIEVVLRPIGEIKVGVDGLRLFLYQRNYVESLPRPIDNRERKLLLIFSPSHYLGAYEIDQFPTGIRGNTLQFPGSAEEGNSIVFDDLLPPAKIFLGGKARELVR